MFGAVEFARGLGFEPHPDFATAADHLGAWSGRCPIQFGYKGTPYYIQGPHDDVESIARTLASTPAAPLHLESTVITEQPNEGNHRHNPPHRLRRFGRRRRRQNGAMSILRLDAVKPVRVSRRDRPRRLGA